MSKDMRVVEKKVHALGQGQGSRVSHSEAVGARPDAGRAVVGDVRDRRRAVGHAKPIRSPTPMGHVEGEDGPAPDVMPPGLEAGEAPATSELRWTKREVWR